MQRLEFSGAVRPIYGSLGVKRLNVFIYFSKGKNESKLKPKCKDNYDRPWKY